MKSQAWLICFLLLFLNSVSFALDSNFDKNVTHGYVNNAGVKIHYVSLGKGPLVLMIHGFPSYWYMWRHQMEALSANYQVVATDQRGYNLSDKPKGAKNYDISLLVEDAVAVVKHLKYNKVIIIGHDWGGLVGWKLALSKPEMVDKLIVLNLPHPNGIMRELKKKHIYPAYKVFRENILKKDAHKQFTAAGLASWVKDADAREKFIEAFNKSDIEAMLNYYKQNPFRKPFKPIDAKVKIPVLMIHGLADKKTLPATLNDTWNWLEKDLTLVTIPDAGHHVAEDASDLVTRSIKMWLSR